MNPAAAQFEIPSLRSRIRNGTLMVLAMMVLLGLYEIPQIWELGGAVRAVLQNNYISILAGRHMESALRRLQIAELRGDPHPELASSRDEFMYWMDVEDHSLTEVGEAELVHDLHNHAARLFTKIATAEPGSRHDAKFDYIYARLTDLVEMNQNAMYHDDARAKTLSLRLMYTFVLGLAFATILGFALSWTLGTTIARPLSELAESLHRVGERKAQLRLEDQKLAELSAVASAFNHMAERLEYYDRMNVERLILEQKKTEVILESLEDGLVLIDSQGIVAHINEVASIIMNIERSDALGKRFDDLGLNHPHYLRVRDALKSLGAIDSHQQRVEVELNLRNRAHSFVLKPIQLMPDDQLIGTLLILQDVTYLRDQDRARTNLFATLSHELRTPLTSMLIAAQTLDRDKTSLSTSQRELVETAVEETTRMKQLSDTLLNLARGQTPSISSHRVKVELARLLEDMARRFAIQAERKSIVLETRLQGTPQVKADPVRLAWVVSNLIGNALRYTPEGGTIELAASSPEANLSQLEVADTGPGIAPEIRAHIFERFSQYSANGYQSGAAGLGLAIVKDIVEDHGGHISVESGNDGRGSRFIVQLPAWREA